ncbi:MAG: hypothetical protein ACOC46_04145, partial [Pirellulales bacterium]
MSADRVLSAVSESVGSTAEPVAADPRAADVALKQQRVAEFLEDEGYEAVLFETQENFAWFTGGGDNSLGMP